MCWKKAEEEEEKNYCHRTVHICSECSESDVKQEHFVEIVFTNYLLCFTKIEEQLE